MKKAARPTIPGSNTQRISNLRVTPKNMKIISWNINSLRAHESPFRMAMDEQRPDIFCLQEIKVREDQQTFPVKGYRSFMNPADMSQYYGTGVYVRNTIHPLSVTFDPPMEGYDYQGRVVAVELDSFYLVNSYWPFSSYHKEGYWLTYRLRWNERFQLFIHELQAKKPVIICGDMNTVRENADAFDGRAVKKAGCFYPEEHAVFDRLLQDENLIDSFRALHPVRTDEAAGSGDYTAWAYSKDNAQRAGNQGFRIDYFLVSRCLMREVKVSNILPDIMGSDHCPILLEL